MGASFADDVDFRPEFLAPGVVRLGGEGDEEDVAVISQRAFFAVDACAGLASIVVAEIRSSRRISRVDVGEDRPAATRGIGADFGRGVEVGGFSVAAVDAIDLGPSM